MSVPTKRAILNLKSGYSSIFFEKRSTALLVEINLVNNSDKTKPPTIYVLDNWRFIKVVPLGLEPRTP